MSVLDARRGRGFVVTAAVATLTAIAGCGDGGSDTAAAAAGTPNPPSSSAPPPPSPNPPPSNPPPSNPPSSGNAAVTLGWTPPTTNSDGSHLDDLAGYRIYYGTTEGQYTQSVTLSNPGLTAYMVENLTTPGTYYFTISAFDDVGNESGYSNVASKTFP
jgi:hypothetical protein